MSEENNSQSMNSIFDSIESKVLKELEAGAKTILKDSERWNIGQKVAAFLVCLFAGAALVTGGSNVKVVGGASIAIFGIAFLTVRRRAIESEVLVLKDNVGKPRIVMSGQYGIALLDENMQVRMQARVNEGHATFHLGRPDGRLLMLDTDDKDSIVVLNRAGERGSLFLRVTDDQSVARIGGKANVSLTAADDGNLGVLLTNEHDQKTALLGSVGLTGHLAFFGQRELTIAEYPDEEAVKSYAKKLVGGQSGPIALQEKAS